MGRQSEQIRWLAANLRMLNSAMCRMVERLVFGCFKKLHCSDIMEVRSADSHRFPFIY